jgi:adenylate cyclase class 1
MERVWAINRARLERTCETLPQRKCAVLETLALLFHINHPGFPGYGGEAVPCGIRAYAPGGEALIGAKRLLPPFELDRRPPPVTPLLGLYLMGSPGSIAQSEQSDFDIWLCHEPQLPAAAVALLQEKAARIEEWANLQGIEVHFFVLNPEEFKIGQIAALSSESSGSSQHYLLLDEFYRSVIVMAGLLPLWWRVPPGQDHRYEEYLNAAEAMGILRRADFIDFGGAHEIPAEEFLGAAVWQLFKSVTSPYKSLLKLILIEVYADEHPRIDLVCNRLKRLVFDGTEDLLALDPYLLTYQKVEEYLFARFDTPRLNLLRQSFYFKVEEALSLSPREEGAKTWRRAHMELLATAWGWDGETLRHLDKHMAWGIDTLEQERQILFKALTRSYQYISEFSRQHGEIRISGQDLHILGRRLYAAFEQKSHKVERIVRKAYLHPTERYLTLAQRRGADGEEGWTLYRGATAAADPQAVPLKRARSAMEILVWCHFNRVMTAGDSSVGLQLGASRLGAAEIRTIQESLEEVFPGGVLDLHPSFEDLTQRPTVRAAALFVNVGVDPLASRAKGGGSAYVASTRDDALSFGATKANLVHSFDLVIRSTWEEVFLFRFAGPTALLDCLAEHLQWAQDPGFALPKVYCGSSIHATLIARRVEECCADICRHFTVSAGEGDSRAYLLQIGAGYQILNREQGKYGVRAFPSLAALEQFLGLPSAGFRWLAVDRNALHGTVYPYLFRLNRPAQVQIFFEARGETTDILVLDEVGALFTQNKRHAPVDVLIRQYLDFQQAMAESGLLGPGGGPVSFEYYLLHRPSREVPQYRIERLDPASRAGGAYHGVQARGDVDPSGNLVLTLACDGQEFSTRDLGGGVFAAAAQYLRRGGATLPVCPVLVAEVVLSPALVAHQGIVRLQTVHFLKYKRLVEERLDQALAQG